MKKKKKNRVNVDKNGGCRQADGVARQAFGFVNLAPMINLQQLKMTRTKTHSGRLQPQLTLFKQLPASLTIKALTSPDFSYLNYHPPSCLIRQQHPSDTRWWLLTKNSKTACGFQCAPCGWTWRLKTRRKRKHQRTESSNNTKTGILRGGHLRFSVEEGNGGKRGNPL
jgi:hypothetical protein